jgi:hypothetical protein
MFQLSLINCRNHVLNSVKRDFEGSDLMWLSPIDWRIIQIVMELNCDGFANMGWAGFIKGADDVT